MIDAQTKSRLLENWGDKAEAMACYAEVKYIDPSSDWACYVYAIDPNDGDTIKCIMHNNDARLLDWSLKELCNCFNSHGEYVIIDKKYVPVRTSELFKKLCGGK